MARPSDYAPIANSSTGRLARYGITGPYAHAGACPLIVRALVRSASERAANDNPPRRGPLMSAWTVNDEVLQAALRYFAQHGLGAARAARAEAEKAFFAGDRHAYDWWIGITRTLDRRLAAEAVKMGLAEPR